MKRTLILATVAFLAGATSCTDGGEAVLPHVPETAVQLAGAIGSSTRAVIGSGYEKDLEVSFVRSDETALGSGVYAPWQAFEAVRSGGSGNRPILFTVAQLYPADGRDIRLQGYYPRVGTVTGGAVTFTVDGETDIMATGLLSGNHLAPIASCLFRHLLTQLQFVCYSDQASDWGSITGIEVEDVHTAQRLTFSTTVPAVAPSLSDVSTAAQIRRLPVSGIAGLPMPEVDEAAPVLPDPQGYILLPVSPETGTEARPLRLRVTTTHDGTGEATATVHEAPVFVTGGFQAGEMHRIELLFSGRMLQVISVSVSDWSDHTTEGGEIDL